MPGTLIQTDPFKSWSDDPRLEAAVNQSRPLSKFLPPLPMRWQHPDRLAELHRRAWQPSALKYFTALWIVRQWDWRRERPRPDLHPA